MKTQEKPFFKSMALNASENILGCKYILVFEPLAIKHVEIKDRGFTPAITLTPHHDQTVHNSIKSNGQSWI